MKNEHKLKLGLEDIVTWRDPDNEFRAGEYIVSEILTESGKIEDFDSVLVIANKAGLRQEVYLVEIE